METPVTPVGGAFLIEETRTPILTPETLPAETRLIGKTVEDFLRKEVQPAADRLDAHEEGLMRRMLQQAGELGLLGAGIPELYGGYDLPKSAIALLTEKAAINPSFAISAGVHSGVGQLPLLYFGTEEQKHKYLPKLASGEWIGAFALSEASSGSDALAAKTRATLSPDGKHYLLTGEKMWITNGGFADLFTVFAQVNGDQFTAFLVERDFSGVTLGREEHKLGLKGSSTRRLQLENAQVPVENVLGEIGKGHRPALYALNFGRLGIAATALGMAKENLKLAAQYAQQRSQFGQPIAHFGLIQHKLGEMAVRTFALESMLYRTAGYLDARFAAIPADAPDAPQRYHAAAEEYAIECAILKFYGTEVQNYVIDEALQIHGGFGYSEEFPIARAYRDARVFRIFEGTNEINRLTVVDQLVKRIGNGRLDISSMLETLEQEKKRKRVRTSDDKLLLLTLAKHHREVTAVTFDEQHQEHGDHLVKQQEIASALADTLAAFYAFESVALRLNQMPEITPLLRALATVFIFQSGRMIQELSSINILHPGFADSFVGDCLNINTIQSRQKVATAVLERGDYPWS